MKKYRNEWKYSCEQPYLDVLSERLSSVLPKDKNSGENGYYTVRSLYFDDVYNSCASENEAGISKRYKYRIRYYENNANLLKLEKKEKANGKCHKKKLYNYSKRLCRYYGEKLFQSSVEYR